MIRNVLVECLLGCWMESEKSEVLLEDLENVKPERGREQGQILVNLVWWERSWRRIAFGGDVVDLLDLDLEAGDV